MNRTTNTAPNYAFEATEWVNARDIWPNTENHEDFGRIPGLLRGYNIEVKTQKGTIDWLSAFFTELEPEDELNHEWRIESRADWGFVPTGRITFRGYYEEFYDFEGREEYVKPTTIAVDELKALAEKYRDK